MEVTSRPAVRIICLDASARVLMLLWRDPSDAALLWEPPGGGIEPGESALAAARRELTEETGLDPAAIVGGPVTVARDVVWNGRHFVGPEQFYLARFTEQRPPLSRRGLLADEQRNLVRHRWLSRAEVAELLATGRERVEPPRLPAVVAELDPEGEWGSDQE